MLHPTNAGLAERVDALLPQTQCRRCGETGCRPYAEAIAQGKAPINRCPPGGGATIAALSALLSVPILPLDALRGTTQPLALARIDEMACIGCTLCINVCPTDAIVGAAKQMHTVIAARCTGCELCLPPCPVTCIDMIPARRPWTSDDADRARQRFTAHNVRIATTAPGTSVRKRGASTHEERKAAVALALARARARRPKPPASA